MYIHRDVSNLQASEDMCTSGGGKHICFAARCLEVNLYATRPFTVCDTFLTTFDGLLWQLFPGENSSWVAAIMLNVATGGEKNHGVALKSTVNRIIIQTGIKS